MDEILISGVFIFLLYYFSVDVWVSGVLVIILIAIFIFIAYIFLPQLKQPVTGAEGMVGMTGVVVETLNPNGTVRIRGELWNAVSINGLIGREEKAMVEKVNGLNLLVKKLKKDNKFLPGKNSIL